MKSVFCSTLVVGLVSVIAINMTTNSVSAQVQAQPASRTQQVQQGLAHEGHAHGKHEHGKETIAFNLPQWKTMHFEDAAKAKQHAEMVKKLGCELVVSEHTGHSDIKFRAPTWRDVHVAEHNGAEELGNWLKKNGFEVAPHKH